jgi:hypothetical protein
MGEIVNMNRARKTRAKALDKAQAAANRVAHGRAKSEKTATLLDRQRDASRLDGKKLDPPKPAD